MYAGEKEGRGREAKERGERKLNIEIRKEGEVYIL